MRFFFRSRGFKIIVAVAAALIAVSVIFAFVGSRMSPQADIMGTLTARQRQRLQAPFPISLTPTQTASN